MMQARSERFPVVSKEAASPVARPRETGVEVGSSPWLFVAATVSFAIVLACVVYLSSVSF